MRTWDLRGFRLARFGLARVYCTGNCVVVFCFASCCEWILSTLAIYTLCKSNRWDTHSNTCTSRQPFGLLEQGAMSFGCNASACGYQYQFMDIYIGWPRNTHDTRVLANSDIYIKGEAGTLLPNKPNYLWQKCSSTFPWDFPYPLLFFGDPAYPLLPWMMKPYSDCGPLTARQKMFNYQLSRAWFVIGECFWSFKGKMEMPPNKECY